MTLALSERNFGFEKVERLAGNIGYLDLHGFMPPPLIGDTPLPRCHFCQIPPP
jgi:hypothetical protein